MESINCNVCHKVAINTKEHVLTEDHFINIKRDIGKNHNFCNYCFTHIIEGSCRSLSERDSKSSYLSSQNHTRKVKRFSEKYCEYPSIFYRDICKVHKKHKKIFTQFTTIERIYCFKKISSK